MVYSVIQPGMSSMPQVDPRVDVIRRKKENIQQQMNILQGNVSASYGEIAQKHVQNVPASLKSTGGSMLESFGDYWTQEAGFPPAKIASYLANYAMADEGGVSNVGRGQRQEAQAALSANQPYIAPQDVGKQYASDVTRGVVEMAPALAASLATKSPAPMLGYAGARGYGESYGEQREAGRTPTQSTLAAIGSGGAEVAFERIPVGILLKQGTPFVKRVVASMVGEGASEAATSVVQQGIQKGTIDPNKTIPEILSQAGYEGLVGAGVGGVMAVPAQAADAMRNKKPKGEKEGEFAELSPEAEALYEPERLALPAPESQLLLPRQEQQARLEAPERPLGLPSPDYSNTPLISTPEGLRYKSQDEINAEVRARELGLDEINLGRINKERVKPQPILGLPSPDYSNAPLISTPEGLRYQNQDEKNQKQRDIELGKIDAPRLSPKAIEKFRKARARREAKQQADAEKLEKKRIRQEVKEQNQVKQGTLLNFVAEQGGIKLNETSKGDLQQIVDKTRTYKFGKGNVVSKKGKDLDRMRELAAEARFIPEDSTTDDLLQAIDKEVRGEPVRRPEDIVEPTTKDYIEDLHKEADKLGISVEGKAPDVLLTEMNQAVEQKKALLEQAIEEDPMLELERQEAVVEEDDIGDIPFYSGFDPTILAKIATPAFKKWFGKSKVVDETGNPKVVYHGTKEDFTEFDPNRAIGSQFWFTDDKSAIETGNVGAAGKGVIKDVMLAIKNPAGWREYDNLTLDEIISRGFDGIILPESDGTNVYIAFEPNQIKDVRNKGEFDPNSNNMFYSGFDPNLIKNLIGTKEERAEFYGMMKKLPKGTKDIGKMLGNGLGVGFLSIDDNLRLRAKIHNMPTIKRIADMLYGGTQDSYGEAVRRRQTVNHNKVGRILTPIRKDKKMLARTIHLIQNPNEIVLRRSHADNGAANITALLNSERQYMRDAGVEVGEIEGYFPRVYDLVKILTDEQGFLKAAQRAYRKTYPELDGKEIKAKAEAWLQNIKMNNSGVNADATDFHRREGIPKPNALKERALGKDADQILKPFLVQDPQDVLQQHFIQTAKRAEFERRFNTDSWKALKEQMLNEAEQQPTLEKQQAARKAIRATVSDMLSATGNLTGNMPQDTNTFLSWMKAFGAMSMLPRATVTALSETAMPALRSMNVKESFAGLSTAWKAYTNDADYQDIKKVAEEVIGVAAKASSDMAAEQRMGGELGTQATNKLMARYFTATGLHGFTEGMRKVSTGVGMRYISALSKDFNNSPAKTKLYLRDLGIAPQQAEGFVKWVRQNQKGKMVRPSQISGEFGEMYKRALTRFVDQSIIKPDAAEKPRYANHKLGSLFYYLQSFIYGFQKNVILQQARNAKRAVTEKDLRAMERVSMAAPLLITPIVLTAIQYGLGEGRDKVFDYETKQEQNEIERGARAISRSGYFGQLDPWVNLFASLKYRKEPATALAGPVIGGMLDTFKALADLGMANSPTTNTQERKAAQMTWRRVIKPALTSIAASSPGYIKVPLIQLLGHPQIEEEFTKTTAGKKK